MKMASLEKQAKGAGELAIELDQKVLPKGFFVHRSEGIGASLHHQRHVLHDA